MRVFTLIIVVLSLLAILEFTSVIPSTSFSILNSFSQIAAFIKSLNIESYYIIVPNISITLPGIITTLIILFVVGYISERFKNCKARHPCARYFKPLSFILGQFEISRVVRLAHP